mgnify:FL=1
MSDSIMNDIFLSPMKMFFLKHLRRTLSVKQTLLPSFLGNQHFLLSLYLYISKLNFIFNPWLNQVHLIFILPYLKIASFSPPSQKRFYSDRICLIIQGIFFWIIICPPLDIYSICGQMSCFLFLEIIESHLLIGYLIQIVKP